MSSCPKVGVESIWQLTMRKNRIDPRLKIADLNGFKFVFKLIQKDKFDYARVPPGVEWTNQLMRKHLLKTRFFIKPDIPDEDVESFKISSVCIGTYSIGLTFTTFPSYQIQF